ncbi:MAG: colanic acid biosynthesis glycosyltransferase WcaL [Hydrocarboniphaga sp.]|uniref:glycosyltransferase n=1 Tax=Hydrocarboniphaga sp. TaxID=2033016 RepID=UPI002611ABE1|nr:glycosyltransferase [Hydrocarboniphaga sp.]MDB5971338.1 colanic acid biosynthesis glycosyltransferase WcaL [Hydrocarboniphaga sp.]
MNSSQPRAADNDARPLRLAFFVHSFPLLSEAFIINQAAALIARGHQVDLYAVWGRQPHVPGQFPIAERAGLFQRCFDPGFAGAPLTRLANAARLACTRFGGRGRVLGRSLNLFEHGRWAANLRLLHEAAMLDRGPYDAVHCQFADLAPIVLRLRRIGAFDAPVITHLRGIDITRRPRELGAETYARIFGEGELFLPNCERFRQKALALGCAPHKLGVFRSAIDLNEFAYRGARGKQRGCVRLALVGRLVEKKGVIYAIDAVARLVARGFDVDLRILGDGPLRAQLESRVAALNLREYVQFLGARGHAEVVALLQASDLLLAPSVTAADGDEDAPVNTLKEGMAIGLPVVATAHGGIPELVRDGHSGRLVAERDAAALADAIADLIRQREQWEQLGRNGRACVEAEYELESQTDHLLRIDRALIERHRGAATAAPKNESPIEAPIQSPIEAPRPAIVLGETAP